MKRTTIQLGIVTLWASWIGVSAAGAKGDEDELAEVLKRAQRSGKPILMYVYDSI